MLLLQNRDAGERARGARAAAVVLNLVLNFVFFKKKYSRT
jgi:hypothetical protein